MRVSHLGAVAVLVGLSACASMQTVPPPSTDHLTDLTGVLNQRVQSSEDAEHVGAFFTSYYVGGERGAARKMQGYNAFEIGANAYTLISLGLKWSLGNPLIASTAALTAKQLQSVYVPGGQAPYTAALQKMACVQSRLGAAVAWEAAGHNLNDVAYRDNLSAVRAAYLAIYAGYRADSKQPDIAVQNMPAKSPPATEKGAGGGKPLNAYSEELKSGTVPDILKGNPAGGGTPIQIDKPPTPAGDDQSLKTALTAATTGMTSCVAARA